MMLNLLPDSPVFGIFDQYSSDMEALSVSTDDQSFDTGSITGDEIMTPSSGLHSFFASSESVQSQEQSNLTKIAPKPQSENQESGKNNSNSSNSMAPKKKRIRKTRAKVKSPELIMKLKTTRRQRANDRERNRMHGLNEALEVLRTTLPNSTESKMTKIETLRYACNYISALASSVKLLEQNKDGIDFGSGLPNPDDYAFMLNYQFGNENTQDSFQSSLSSPPPSSMLPSSSSSSSSAAALSLLSRNGHIDDMSSCFNPMYSFHLHSLHHHHHHQQQQKQHDNMQQQQQHNDIMQEQLYPNIRPDEFQLQLQQQQQQQQFIGSFNNQSPMAVSLNNIQKQPANFLFSENNNLFSSSSINTSKQCISQGVSTNNDNTFPCLMEDQSKNRITNPAFDAMSSPFNPNSSTNAKCDAIFRDSPIHPSTPGSVGSSPSISSPPTSPQTSRMSAPGNHSNNDSSNTSAMIISHCDGLNHPKMSPATLSSSLDFPILQQSLQQQQQQHTIVNHPTHRSFSHHHQIQQQQMMLRQQDASNQQFRSANLINSHHNNFIAHAPRNSPFLRI